MNSPLTFKMNCYRSNAMRHSSSALRRLRIQLEFNDLFTLQHVKSVYHTQP